MLSRAIEVSLGRSMLEVEIVTDGAIELLESNLNKVDEGDYSKYTAALEEQLESTAGA